MITIAHPEQSSGELKKTIDKQKKERKKMLWISSFNEDDSIQNIYIYIFFFFFFFFFFFKLKALLLVILYK